ncbi:MAG TPA: amino acid adenylation domain-containing protein [Candidatus Saccharimonadales bacterium]|nr:amino acid adenylation domain-containing protein [Candidatus Saccharimonadales bacterium]
MSTQEHNVTDHADSLSNVKHRLLREYLNSRQVRNVVGPRPAGAHAPLAFSQQQVWLHSQMASDVPFYNETMTIYRQGALDAALLQRCLAEIIRRHEIWRTTFEMVDGEPQQVVHPASGAFPLRPVDLRELPEMEREAEAKRLATLDAQRPFDLQSLPLLRVLLVRMGDEQHRLYITIHQIIFDAVTAYSVFLSELAALYEAFSAGRPSPLRELRIQYADYAFDQRKRPDAVIDQHAAYWMKQLAGELPLLEWPNDRPRPPVDSHRGAIQRFELSASVVARIKQLGPRYEASPYMTLLAGLAALLHRYTGQEDVVLGTFTAGRKRAEFEPLMGYFVNPLALRVDLSGRLTFADLLARIRGVVLDALAHDDVPFVRVVRELQTRPDTSRNPLFQIALSQQPKMPEIAPGWNLATEEICNGGSKLDLIVVIDDRGDRIFGPITYNPDLFSPATIARMVEHWQQLLAGAAIDPEMRVADLALLTEAERAQIVLKWNDTRAPYPREMCLYELIEAQAEHTPNATAVVFEKDELSYGELNARANQLAHYLRKLGVGPELLVGVSMERSIDMMVALLAIMKAGGAYVPLDPSYPKTRISFMIEDSDLRFLVTRQGQELGLADYRGELICMDRDWPVISQESRENPTVLVKPENLVYVIYTSGSTGRPKGVQIPHRALVNLLMSVQNRPGLALQDSFLAVTTISFDIAALELYLPLIVGARCVLAGREAAADGQQLSRLLEGHDITAMQATPSTWKLLLQSGWAGKRNLKILCGGEAWSRELAGELLRRSASVWNMYGPTETTVWSAVYRVTSDEGPMLIGHPIANTEMYVLDRNFQPLPVGVTGELYIGGEGLARGYRNRADLDSEKFISGLLGPQATGRLYRTGDLARYHADGSLECLGRLDNQVKVRGFRIELGEIEAVLRQHPAVCDVCVAVRDDGTGDPRLAAYVVLPEPDSSSLVDLRSFLKERLPGYMLPVLCPLERLPLTPNGKVDRHALPDPASAQGGQGKSSEEFQEPGELSAVMTSGDIDDPVGQVVMALWTDILKVPRISIYDNFFDLGGHSLLATQMVARLEKELGLRMKPKELAFQTLAQFAASCRERMQCQ